MSGSDLKWYPFCETFPAGLDTATDPTKLKDGFTPDGYGMSPLYPGRLVASACPTGTALVKYQPAAIGGNTWTWYFRRLWRANVANLYYNSPEYTATDIPQGLGILSFDEDTQSIVTFLPFGNHMYVGKSTGGYAIAGAASLGGNFQHGDIFEGAKVSAAANVTELDGTIYVSNGYGLMAFNGNETTQLTSGIEDATTLADFQNIALTPDFQRKFIIGTSRFCYDVGTKKLFRYTSTNTGFRFTSRTLIAKDDEPFLVDGIAISYLNTGTDNPDGELKYQIKRDQDWESEETVDVIYDEGSRNRLYIPFENREDGRRFALRLTALSSHIHILRIDVNTALIMDTETGVQ
jgi:hypothetical protein